jgi:hypothetical protein
MLGFGFPLGVTPRRFLARYPRVSEQQLTSAQRADIQVRGQEEAHRMFDVGCA